MPVGVADRGRWYLLAPRPGWRMSEGLSADVQLEDGTLRLADQIPLPTIFDCPPPTCSALPCCEQALLQATCRRVLVITGTGQVRLALGPYAYDAHDALIPADYRCELGEHACRPAPAWPDDTWSPAGVIAVGRGVGVVDRAHRVVHVFAASGELVRTSDGSDLPGCPWPEGTPRYRRSGTFVSTALDSGLPECIWHRVALNVTVPLGTRVTVATLTTDADLTEGEIAALGPERWATAGVCSDPAATGWDALIASPPGRYLWLSVSLDGDGAETPGIDDVEVHFPRRTSLRYLPAVFRTGPDGGSFLDRFLAATDTVRGSVTTEIDRVPWLLDPRSADAAPGHDFLGWLGQWIGMTGTGLLPTARRRRLIGEAAQLYRRRGTPDGITRHVSLWLGRRVQILEHYRLRRWAVLGHGRLGDATRLFGPEIVRRLQLDEFSQIGAFQLIDTPSPRIDPFAVYAHRFTLFVHACADDDPDQLAATAAQVVAAVQPGHCVSSVAVVLPRMRVGAQATVGIDSVVAGPTPVTRLGDGRLGEGIAIARDPRCGDRPAIGIDARVGTRAAIA